MKRPVWIEKRDALALHDRLLALTAETFKLESRKGPIKILVIDSANKMPTKN